MNQTSELISDRRRGMEITAVLLTAGGKFIFMDWLRWKLPFILIAIIAWTAYVFLRRKQRPDITRYWGFRADNFKDAMKMLLPFGIVSISVFFILGFYLDSIIITWHIFPILLLYPIWGTIQQFLVIGIVAGNLKDLRQARLSNTVIIIVTALLFGMIHYPFYWLMFGTFILALFYGYIYLRIRNLYVLGIFHGWLGGVFFYTVVGRDPFIEIFAALFSR